MIYEFIHIPRHISGARADLRGGDARDTVAPETAPNSTKKLPTASSRGDEARRRRRGA